MNESPDAPEKETPPDDGARRAADGAAAGGDASDAAPQPEEAPFRIRIEGPGLTFEREVDRELAYRLLEVAAGAGARRRPWLPPVVTVPRPEEFEEDEETPPSRPGPPPIRGAIEHVSPRNNPQRIATIAAYLEDGLRRTDGLRWEEVRGWFERAGEDPPVNLGRDLREAVERGLIEERPDGSRRYFVTEEGRRHIGISVDRPTVPPTRV